ncbi:MAG: hypothetical protein VKS61_05360 [Candidatus Sericytochromatia bacterium]|nr:hypothetical protein [Candidatus Sericytochromatia bacterium]
MAWRRLALAGLALGLLAGQAQAAPSPSPSPLRIRAISVEVVPIQVGPGLSVPAPRADRIELPAGARRFRSVRPAPIASASATPRSGTRP